MDASLCVKRRIHSVGLLTLVMQKEHTGDYAADAQCGSQ